MSRKTQIITDSGSDLRAEMLNGQCIRIVDMPIVDEQGNEAIYNTDDAIAGFYKKLRNGEKFKTSQASIKAYFDEFHDAASKGLDIIYIGLSSALTSSIGSAKLAREEVLAEFPSIRIELIDSMAASLGYGIPVLNADDMAEDGAGINDIYEFLMTSISSLEEVFTVGDLSYLYQGGRLSRTSYAVASAINIKPILNVNLDGKLAVFDRARGVHKARQKVAEYVRKNVVPNTELHCVHTDCIEGVYEVLDSLESYGLFTKISISMMGATIGAHVGSELIGFVFSNQNRSVLLNNKRRELVNL